MDLHSISFTDSVGAVRTLADFSGKVILIVNTATKCGLVPQLTELQALHKKYEPQGLVIIGFPSDQFNQEPEANGASAAKVCAINFGVDFLIADKIRLNGPDAHPLYVELRKALPGFLNNKIKWNFTKFLIARDGSPTKRYAPTTKPFSFEKDIQNLLLK